MAVDTLACSLNKSLLSKLCNNFPLFYHLNTYCVRVSACLIKDVCTYVCDLIILYVGALYTPNYKIEQCIFLVVFFTLSSSDTTNSTKDCFSLK